MSGSRWPIRGGRWVWALMLIGAAANGCSRAAQPACFAVRGQVVRDGKPLAEAMIVFHPLGDHSPGTPKPLAQCDEQGRFTLSTFHTNDGAPAGSYAITVELRAPRQVGEEITRDGPNGLPARFASPQITPLRYQVVEGDNEVPPLAITAQ